MKIIIRWNVRIFAVSIVTYIISLVIARFAMGALVQQPYAYLVVADAAAALVSGIASVYACLLKGGANPELDSYREYRVMQYLGVAYALGWLSLLFLKVMSESGVGMTTLMVWLALSAASLVFADVAARTPRYIQRRESETLRSFAAMPFVGFMVMAIPEKYQEIAK